MILVNDACFYRMATDPPWTRWDVPIAADIEGLDAFVEVGAAREVEVGVLYPSVIRVMHLRRALAFRVEP